MSFMLSVTIKPIMLSAVMPNVIKMNVVVPHGCVTFKLNLGALEQVPC
jgi:hypothetical protein